MRHLLFCLAILCSTSTLQAEVTVEYPSRAFGYFIGDVLTQQIRLDATADEEPFLNPQLEIEQRIDAYLYRVSSDVVMHDEVRWLDVRYQIVNAPLNVQGIELPTIELSTSSGQQQQSPAWQFTVGPLLANAEKESEATLLADRSALDTLKTPDTAALKSTAAALLLTLLCWLCWWLWRHMLDTKRLAFAQAMHRIRKLPQEHRDEEQRAWVALHHAFNQTAGKALSSSSVDDLLTTAPWLKTLESEIRDFYLASAERFYHHPPVIRRLPVSKLCKRLAKLEKSHSGSSAVGVHV